MGDELLTKSVNDSHADTTKHAKHAARDARFTMALQDIMSHNTGEEILKDNKRKFYNPRTNKPRDGTESSCCHSPPDDGKRFRIDGPVARDNPRTTPPASLTPDLVYLRFEETSLLESSKPLLSVPPAPALGPPTKFQATTPRNFSEDGKGVLLGYWKLSPEQRIADKHAIHGIIWRNGAVRLKIVPYKRDGNPVEGNSPSGLGIYHVSYDDSVFEPYLEGLTRTEIEEYCRVWTEYNDVDWAIEVDKRRVAIFEPYLKGLTCTEIEEYCRICKEYNDVNWAIEVAKRRVAINSKAEGLNSAEFDEKNRIRLANQAQNQKPRSLRAHAKKEKTVGKFSWVMRLGSNEAKYTATVNSTRGPETAETMCQNVDDMPSTPPRRRILRKRTHSPRTSLLEPSEESDGDILKQTSDFEPDEESDEDISDFESSKESDEDISDFESSKESDEDISASENANAHQAVGSRQESSQNADPLSANNIMVERAGHRQRHSKRTSSSGDPKGSSMGARSELPVPQKDMPQKLIVKLPLPSLSYSKGSLKYEKATPVRPVEEAIGLVRKDFTGDLSVKDMVAAVNAVRKNCDAYVFLILKDDKNLRMEWVLTEVEKSRLGISS
ncbi:hypothetical protein V502_04258 [Pseudogymnoascus sp. VKM F-4520 (FW-2644)]|nr:hypothetical protein V502_04258 [Pseudogymnoascus sp. VKM F-4520 (FW-2644)]